MTSEQISSFQFWNTLIGLVASILGIYGFVAGIFSADVLPTKLDNPLIFSVITFIMIYYFCFMISYLICSRQKSHWKFTKSGQFTDSQPIMYYMVIIFIVFIPVYVFWCFSVADIMHLTETDSSGRPSNYHGLFIILLFISYVSMTASIVVIDETHRNENMSRTRLPSSKSKLPS